MITLALIGCQGSQVQVSHPPRPASYVNPIPAENQLAGDASWSSGDDATAHEIEGYADRISARAGESIAVRVASTASTTATWALYRLGWYGGAGARLVRGGGPLPVAPQPPCPVEAGTGLVRCTWQTTFAVPVLPQDVSGLYALKLVRQDGKTRFIPLVVTDRRPADLLLKASVQTYEAYNTFGGESLYSDNAKATPYGYAVKVSFDRPFQDQRGLGQMLGSELPMARFLEQHGYDVSYATNLEVSLEQAPFLERAGMFVIAGHDEYWTGAERAAVAQAVAAGVSLATFAANTAYQKVRYEDFDGASNPRTIACYKAGDDPLGAAASGLNRGPSIHDPENSLFGVMYDSWQLRAFPFVAGSGSDASWFYEGAGLRPGDAIAGIVGHEFDRRFDNGAAPANLTVLARSPVVDAGSRPGWSEAVAYRAASGALVFSAGTIYWSRALDPAAVPDARVARLTANVFHHALGLPVPPALANPAAPVTTPPMPGPAPAQVSTAARGLSLPGGLAALPGTPTGTLVVTAPRTAQVFSVAPNAGAPPLLLAGTGAISNSAAYDNVPGLKAAFNQPVAVAADAAGRIYVADSGSNAIRRIDVDAAHTTTTFAGALGVRGSADGAAATARFFRPSGIAFDAPRARLVVADTFNHRVRGIDLATGQVTTIAGGSMGDADGPGTSARFAYPTGVAVASDGRIFVLTSSARAIKVILPDAAHTVVTLAGAGEGFADGAGMEARLSPQAGVAWTGTFLALSDAPNFRLRAVAPTADSTAASVSTLAFDGRSGNVDGRAEDAEIGLPVGLAMADDGTLYVADAVNGSVRAVRLP